MLISILANLIALYSLVVWPSISGQTIDVSRMDEQKRIQIYSSEQSAVAPYRLNNNSLGMKVTAQAAIIADKSTGLILWQKNPNDVRPIASISKLLTALVFLDNDPGWHKEVVIQQSDYREGGRIYVYNGEKIMVKDLFNASLVASSNNATVALARFTGLTPEEFVWAMNDKAAQLGMVNSKFFEPTGLDPANVSTASDLIKLAKAALSRPEIIQATTQSEYTFNVLNANRTYTLKNTDQLLNSYLKIAAGKTGYLDEAGYCLKGAGEGVRELGGVGNGEVGGGGTGVCNECGGRCGERVEAGEV